MTMPSFVKRVENFWDWFAANEDKLSKFVENRTPDQEFSQQVVKSINEGLSLISEGLLFNIGGNYEFTFATNGNKSLFFLLPYVTANLPEQFRSKWKFFSCMQGTKGEKFGFNMYDVIVSSENVMVSAVPNDGEKNVNLQFYAKEWTSLEDKDCFNAFYTLMDICIGEALSVSCIYDIQRADEITDGMFPLTQLEKWLVDNMCEDGIYPNPAQSYSVYSFKPQDSPKLRFDIFTGSTNCTHLINDYFSDQDTAYNTISSFGAKPIFLWFCYDSDEDRKETFEKRNDLMDMLEDEVLGVQGSGKEIGVILGGAMGLYNAYIDILLFDQQAFMEKAKTLLEDHNIMFFVKDFVYNGQEQLLFDHKDSGFDKRLNQLHNAEAHDIIIQLFENLPEDERSYTLTSIYARALNNVNRLDDAVKVLESIRSNGENDPLWHFRYGYALCYSGRPKEAITAFQRSKELDDSFDDVDEFIAICEEKLKKP